MEKPCLNPKEIWLDKDAASFCNTWAEGRDKGTHHMALHCLWSILAYVLSRISSLALPPLVWTLLVMACVLTKHPVALKLFNLFCLYSLNPRKSSVPAFERQIEVCKHVPSARTVWSTRSNREWEAAHLQPMRFGGRISGEIIWTNCPVPQSSG